MFRSFCVLAALTSLPALAVNEGVALKGPLSSQLSPSLCVSMECDAAEAEFTVTSTAQTVKVARRDGRVVLEEKLHAAPTNTEAMELSARILKAIETPASSQVAAAEAPAKAPAHVAKAKKLKAAPVKLATRLHSQRRG